MNSKVKYIIYSPPYDENVGGIIVLHKLCAILRDMNFDVALWHSTRPSYRELRNIKGLKKLLSWLFRYKFPSIFGMMNLHSPYQIDLAAQLNIKSAIVIYPEIVDGNPLGSKNVIRWFLNKPGRKTGRVNFGPNELYFYYGEHFNDPLINTISDNKLCVTELMKDIYYDRKRNDRSGMCYMVRKGRGRVLSDHDLEAVCIDGLPHALVAEIFNSCEYFVSYDLYTYYSQYAVMCGCISIVVPEADVSKDKWLPNIADRYGIAYGWDDIPWALQTREELFKIQSQSETASINSVRSFTKKVHSHYYKT